ncbi:hypothetical protein D3C81_2216300 [compost metagenome]
MDKVVLFIAFQRLQVGQVARIGKRIEVKNGFLVVSTPLQNEIRADEAGPACH